MLFLENTEYQYHVHNEYEEIDLRELIMEIWTNKWIICFITFLFVLAAGIYSFFIAEPVYQANATIELSNIEGVYSNPDTVTIYVKSNTLVMPVMEEFGRNYNEGELQKYLGSSLTIANPDNTRIIDLSLKNKDPLLARELLNGILLSIQENANLEYRVLIGKLQEDISSAERKLNKTDEEIEKINQVIDNISNSNLEATEKNLLVTGLLNKLSIYIEQNNKVQAEKKLIENKLISYRPFKIINNPYTLESPISPRKLFNLAIAGVLGGFLSLLFVFGKKYLMEDNTGQGSMKNT